MDPLRVIVLGSEKERAELLSKLTEQLAQRGLKVGVSSLSGTEAAPKTDCNILFLSCSAADVGYLARRLEQEWTKDWSDWYASHKKGVSPLS